MEEEYKKLEDLEFEYNLARISGQDEETKKKAKIKLLRQLSKVKKMQEEEKEELIKIM